MQSAMVSKPSVAATLQCRSSAFSTGLPVPAFVGRVAPKVSKARTVEVQAGKGKGKQRFRQNMSPAKVEKPPTPPVDPDNEEFVVFIRAVKLPKWMPLSVVKGGAPANVLAKQVKDEGIMNEQALSGLTRNIANAVNKDRGMIIKTIQKQVPGYSSFKDFEFGYKIRDKSVPDMWYVAENVILLPDVDEIEETPVEKAQEAFSSVGKNLKGLFGGN